MGRRIVFAPEARDDLNRLYLFIAERSGVARAIADIERIESFCRSFSDFPERVTKRDDLLEGLRIIGFERRVALAFHVGPEAVTFDRILYGGRDLSKISDEI